MDIRTYDENRARFSLDELRQHEGKWAAFSMDGARLIASAIDLEALDVLLRAAGEDPQSFAYEKIVLEDDWMGAAQELEFE